MNEKQRKSKRLKMLHDSGQIAAHFKMYKAGRTWLFAGITVLLLGTGAFCDTPGVKADTVPDATSNVKTASTNSSASATMSSAATNVSTNSTVKSISSASSANSQSSTEKNTTSAQSSANSAVALHSSADVTSSAASENSASSSDSTQTSDSQATSLVASEAQNTSSATSVVNSSSSVTSVAKSAHLKVATLAAKAAVSVTRYTGTDLVNDGTITVNSLNWTNADNSTMNYYQTSTPTDGLLTINVNSKLKSGDTIDLGTLSISGQLTGSATAEFSPANLPGIGTLSGSVITLDDTYDATVEHAIKFEFPKNMAVNTSKNKDDNSLKITETYLGQTITINYAPVTPKPVSGTGTGGFTEKVYQGGTTAYAFSSVQFGSTQPYADLLSSGGKTMTDTTYPDQDLVYVWKFAANPNLKGVVWPGIYENGGTTGMQGIMPDASSIAANGQNTNGDFGMQYHAIPSDTAINEVENVLPIGDYTTYEDADGNWYAAVNFGQFGTDDAVKTTADWVTDSVNNNPWNAEEGAVEKAVNALTGDNAINGSFISAGIQVNAVPVDPTYVTPFTVAVYSSSNDFKAPIGTVYPQTQPSRVAVAGQNTVQFVLVDQDKNVIGPSTIQAGWADGNSVGKPATKYGYKPDKTLTGYNGEKYSLDASSLPEYTGYYSLTNQIFYVVYDAPASATLTYVDDDENGEQVGDSVVQSGFANDSITFANSKIPAGYVMADNQPDSTKFTNNTGVITYTGKLTADDSDNVTIHLVRETTTTTPTDPSDPDYAATHQSVTETINYQYEDGSKAADTVTNTLAFTRTVTTDKVTGEKTYGAWTAVDGDTFAEVTSPVVVNYTANPTSVAAQKVAATDADIAKTVTYTANDADLTVTYVDDTDGSTVSTDTVTGKYNATGTYDVTVPTGYVLADGQAARVDYTLTTDNSDNITVHLVHETTTTTPTDPSDPDYAATHQSVTETINYQYEDGSKAADTVTNTLAFTRTVTTDKATGGKTYGAWTAVDGDTFAEVTSPVVANYTANPTSVAAQKVAATDEDIAKTVTYTANDADLTVTYVDDTDGSTVSTDTVTGKYNATGTYDVTVPTGYVLADGQAAKVDYTLTTDNSDNITVHLVHKKTTATPTDPSDPDYAATHQSVTETINYQYEDGSKAADTVTNTLAFTRTVTTDKATGNKTYGAWTAVDGDTFAEVTSPVVTNYTANPTSVAAQKVAATDADIAKTVTYTANDADLTVTYVDDTDGSTVSTDTITGKYNATGTYDVTVPTGYVLADGQADSLAYKLTTDDSDNITVHLVHGTKVVHPGDPNANDYDLTKTISETINYVNADGKQIHNSVRNTVDFNRTVTVDVITGKVISYSNWTTDNATFPTVVSPSIVGYTPNTKEVAAQTVTADSNDVVENVVYESNRVGTTKPTKPNHQGKPETGTDTDGNFGKVPETNTSATTTGSSKSTNSQFVGKKLKAVETTQTEVKKSKLTTNSQEKRLPQTNETQTNANSLGILGLFVAALLSLFGISFKKRRQ